MRGLRIVEFAVDRPKATLLATSAAVLILALLAALPSLPADWPVLRLPAVRRLLGRLHAVRVDTDPENMLSPDEPVRLFHHRMKKKFSLHDMIVVGVVNDHDPQGVFNPESLRKIYQLTEYAKTLNGSAIGQPEGQGVIVADVIAPSTVDSLQPGKGNEVKFDWLMPAPPTTRAEALDIRRKAMRVPFLKGTVVSDDGKAVAIYLPLTRKDLSYAIYTKLMAKIAELGGPERFHITGLPVAEDVFGVEMFVQMAISAPAAMVVIFVLMLLFFRKLAIVVSPMIVAIVSVIFTMAALIIAGQPIHIMSSMIPIFIMPIAVLDSIHIISEFFEKYQATRDRRKTVIRVMDELFVPMLYTSLTSAAGFASLALTPIPPVQVFGLFVAMGIMAAWLLTITLIPACIMFISPKSLETFGATHARDGRDASSRTALGRMLYWMGGVTYHRAKLIVAVAVVVLIVAGVGISRIVINDNPVKWFTRSHPIRVADRVLNAHFGGTYMAYLSAEYHAPVFDANSLAAEIAAASAARRDAIHKVLARVVSVSPRIPAGAATADAFFDAIDARVSPDRDLATDDQLAVWSAAKEFLSLENSLFDEDNPFDRERYQREIDARVKNFTGQIDVVFAKVPAFVEGALEGRRPSREEFFRRLAEQARKARYPQGESGDSAGDEDDPFAGAESGGPREIEMEIVESDAPSVRPEAGKSDLVADGAWEVVELFLDEQRQRGEVFKDPRFLRRLARLQESMGRTGMVGKSNSLVDLIRTINRDLHGGDANYYVIPANRGGVAQCIDQFLSSHRPDDLYHFVTPDYRASSIWVQLTSGDNKDMTKVVDAVARESAVSSGKPLFEQRWFGLTYINVVWQDKMVSGMLRAFAGSFLVVFLLMTVLFRSALWGLLSMIPLTVTIAAIYGVVGLIGKDYDMPVAVLSSLTLGLAVDFAIHFLARSRAMYAAGGTWRQTAPNVFGEPARAIARNVIVIAVGFLPLLLAPLIPYKTVGVLLAAILLVSGAATLLLLPAMIHLLEKQLFPAKPGLSIACNCVTCLVSAIALAALVILSARQYLKLDWSWSAGISAVIILVVMGGCMLSYRRTRCKAGPTDEETDNENN